MATIDSISYRFPSGVRFADSAIGEFSEELFSPDALQFSAKLEREFGERRRLLLKRRNERQMEFNIGKMPDFLPETENIRTSYWRTASIPNHLLDRRVEVISPPKKETIANAYNAGANSFIADFEDTNSPTWHNIVNGQLTLQNYVRSMSQDRTGDIPLLSRRKEQEHQHHTMALIVCPRGWQAEEKHVLIDGKPISASLFDFGMFFYHNARELLSQDSGPYFYLPKIESAQEAALWNDVFLMAQDELHLPHGSIKASVIIETVPAAFEMHEILYALKEHCIGLACGRWNYIFSLIKNFRHHKEFLLPDYSHISMLLHFLYFFSVLLIQTCHKRGAHAIGGITSRQTLRVNSEPNEEALAHLFADKERDVEDGFDGTWVIDPEAVAIAKAAFDSKMSGPNQLHRKRRDVQLITAQDLLTAHTGGITEEGVRRNIGYALEYFAAWLNGEGIVRSRNSIEHHAATAEIARAQLWQWFHHGNKFLGGQKAEKEFYRHMVQEELQKLSAETGGTLNINYALAKKFLESLIFDSNFADFFTTELYQYLD